MDREAMAAERARLKAAGRTLVFTNGAFDLLHAGHATYLQWARQQGDALAVGLNSDASVRRYKGERRPIIPQDQRALLLASLECVDYVVVFDEDEPRELIAALLPDVLVKGSDWAHYVSGRDIVEAHGGRVVLANMVAGLSTTKVMERVVEAYGATLSSTAPRSQSQSQSQSPSPTLTSSRTHAPSLVIPSPGSFGHEKLHVYRLAQEFLAWSSALWRDCPTVVRDLRDQLDRAALSIALNTAEGNGKRARRVRARFFDDARGSAAECAACLDAMVSKSLVSLERIAEGKSLLERVSAMLTRLVRRFDAEGAVREKDQPYSVSSEDDCD